MSQAQPTIQAIVTDIEGTTSDIRFVHNVLFPYARERLAQTVAQADAQPEIAQALTLLREEIAQPQADTATLLRALHQFIDEDRKSTALKRLQGIIWREGYQRGDFRGHVYDDVSPQLAAWHQQGIALYVYSSGSVEAQQLLFGHSDAGDLCPLFSAYFDTRVGAKRETASYQRIADAIGLPVDHLLFLSDIRQETASYQRIADAIGLPVDHLLFLSDIRQELDAAAQAGWHTCQLIRDEDDNESRHPQVARFDQIDLSSSHNAV